MASVKIDGIPPDTISISPLLQKLLDPSKGPASSDEIAAALALTFHGRLSPEQCSSFLTLLAATGRERDSEVVAKCAAQMREAAVLVDRHTLRQVVRKRGKKEGSYRGGLCDIVGTGGDGHSTFNVSTTASIVASANLLVSKHGGQASSSKSGSADVLQAITPRAPNIEAITATTLPRAYESGNFTFLFAPTFHPSMRHAKPIRRQLGFRTIFNYLGPLANPVDAAIEARVCGVAKRELGPVYAEALRLSGVCKALVVCGVEELDEISCAGPTNCWWLKPKRNPAFKGSIDEEDEEDTTSDEEAPPQTLVEIEHFQLRPQDFGFEPHGLDEVLPGRTPAENAQVLVKLLKNELDRNDPTLEFVLINAAAMFVVAGVCDTKSPSVGPENNVVTGGGDSGPGNGRWKEGVKRARLAVESGQAWEELKSYIDFTNSV